MSLFGMPEGVPCCCSAGCCPETILPDCITLELVSSCCVGDTATVVLTNEGAATCAGGTSRPTTAAESFCSPESPDIIYTGALDSAWCASAELSNGTVLVFCCLDPITNENTWWIYFADSDPAHTWYPDSTSQYYPLTLVSCNPLLLQFGSDYTCSPTQCVWTLQAACFIGGTLIETLSGGVDIKDLKIGDTIVDIYGRPVRVRAVMVIEVDTLIRLTGENGLDTGVTPEHPFIDNDLKTTIAAGTLVPGQKLPLNKTIVATKIERGKWPVYNLSVTGSNTFIADGFAVHNKGQ